MLLASSSVIREINVPALGTKYCLLTGCAATFSAVVANNIPINKCFIFMIEVLFRQIYRKKRD